MRRSGALLGVITLVGLALAIGARGEAGTRACARRACNLGRLPTPIGGRLPAPITISAGHVVGAISYRIGRNGQISRTAGNSSGLPRNAAWFPATGTWFMYRDGHLLVGRAGQPAWRSRRRIAPNQVGLIIASPRMVAFQHDHELYVASQRGPERPVAKREMPLGFTRGGLYTYRYAGRELLLRSDTGALRRTIASSPFGGDYLVAGGRLYFIAHGALMSALGPRVRRLALLADLGMSSVWLQSIGPLLELQDNRRIVVLRPEGTVFASTALPRRDGRAETISSSLAPAPGASAVAFTAAADEPSDPSAQRRTRGAETIYLMRPGSRIAIPIHSEHVVFRVCERGAVLQWHGRWLLYSNSEGHLAAIDTTAVHHAIRLASLVRRLRGARDGFSASWSGQPIEP
jgi:hypothetical protein